MHAVTYNACYNNKCIRLWDSWKRLHFSLSWEILISSRIFDLKFQKTRLTKGLPGTEDTEKWKSEPFLKVSVTHVPTQPGSPLEAGTLWLIMLYEFSRMAARLVLKAVWLRL